MKYSFLFPMVQKLQKSTKNARAIVENKVVPFLLVHGVSALGLTTKLNGNPSNFKHNFGLNCVQS